MEQDARTRSRITLNANAESKRDEHEKGTSSIARAHCRRSVGHGSTGRNVISVPRWRTVRPPSPTTYFRPLYTRQTHRRPRASRPENVHAHTRARAHTHTTRTHNLADVRRATRPWPSFGGGKSVYVLRTRTRTHAGGRTTAVGGGPGGRAPVVDGRNIADGRLRGKPETSTAMTGPLSIALAFSPVVGRPR